MTHRQPSFHRQITVNGGVTVTPSIPPYIVRGMTVGNGERVKRTCSTCRHGSPMGDGFVICSHPTQANQGQPPTFREGDRCNHWAGVKPQEPASEPREEGECECDYCSNRRAQAKQRTGRGAVVSKESFLSGSLAGSATRPSHR